MTEEEIQELIEQSQLDESTLDEDLRRKVFEYLISMRSWSKSQNENFIFRIPASTSREFIYNHVFSFYQGHLEKTSNEIVALPAWENLKNPSVKGARLVAKRSKAQKTEPKDELLELKTMIESLQDSINKLNRENRIMKELIYSDASSFDDKKTTQTMPIDIYLDTNESQEIFEVYDSVLKFAKSVGFDETIEFEAVKGSWFKRLIAKSSEKLSSEDVQDRLKEAEYGIEVNTILKKQSEIDKNQSEALSNIITSLKDIPNAAIRIGALIVVKLTDEEGAVSLQTRTLSIKELHLLNKKPELLQMPKQILQALAKEIDDNLPPQISEN
jgi:hypothetical protein